MNEQMSDVFSILTQNGRAQFSHAHINVTRRNQKRRQPLFTCTLIGQYNLVGLNDYDPNSARVLLFCARLGVVGQGGEKDQKLPAALRHTQVAKLLLVSLCF